MFKQAYDLICEILEDVQLNQYIKDATGKALSIISAGPQVDTPAVRIALNGGEFNRSSNTSREIVFSVTFDFPFWGDDAFEQGIEFIDFALPIFFDYGSGKNNKNVIVRAVPSINEINPENDFWSVNFNLTIKILLF